MTWRAALEAGLVCPRCAARNRPGQTVIEVPSAGGDVAQCGVCRHEGPRTEFVKETT